MVGYNQWCAARISFRTILFVIYFNTLIEFVKYSSLFLFADDNKLFKIIQSEQDSYLLKYDIDSMYNWTLNSLLLFHPKKCFTMHIDSKSTGSNLFYDSFPSIGKFWSCCCLGFHSLSNKDKTGCPFHCIAYDYCHAD